MRIGKLWSLSAVSPKEGPYSRRMECREEGEATHPRSGGGGEARGRENSDGTHREARAATPPSAASRPLPSAGCHFPAGAPQLEHVLPQPPHRHPPLPPGLLLPAPRWSYLDPPG